MHHARAWPLAPLLLQASLIPVGDTTTTSSSSSSSKANSQQHCQHGYQTSAGVAAGLLQRSQQASGHDCID